MIRNLKEMEKEFEVQTKKLENVSDSILSSYNNGTLPDASLWEDLEKKRKDLTELYHAIYETASYSVDKADLPENGAPIHAYIDAVAKRQSSIRSILTDFIRVHSVASTPCYQQDLQPYQDKAVEMLLRIGAGEAISTEELLDAQKAPVLFLRALSLSNSDSAEAVNLFQDLQKNFPNSVPLGLATRIYVFDDENTNDAENNSMTSFEKASTPIVIPAIMQDVQNGEKNEEKSEPMENEHNGEDDENPETHKSDATTVETVHTLSTKSVQENDEYKIEISENKDSSINKDVVTEKASLIYDILSNEGAFYNAQNLGKVQQKISKRENRKCQSKSCKHELFQMQGMVCRIVNLIYFNNGVTLSGLSANIGPGKIANTCLNYLFSLGYLRILQVAEEEPVYCATDRLNAALSFESIRHGLKGLLIKGRLPVATDNVTSRWVLCINLINESERIVADIINEEHIKPFHMDFTIGDGYFFKSYSYNHNHSSFLHIGAAFDADVEKNSLSETWNDLPKMCKAINGSAEIPPVIVALGLDTEHAASLMRTVIRFLHKQDSEAHYVLYDLKEKKYLSFPDEKKISIIDLADIEEQNKTTSELLDANSDLLTDPTNESKENEAPMKEDIPREEQEYQNEENKPSADKNEEMMLSKEKGDETSKVEVNKKISVNTEETRENSIHKDGVTFQNPLFASANKPTKNYREDRKEKNDSDHSRITKDLEYLFSHDLFYGACTYLTALNVQGCDRYTQKLCNEVSYAFNDPAAYCHYQSEQIMTMLDEEPENPMEQALICAGALRLYFFSQNLYDNSLDRPYEILCSWRILEQNPNIRDVMYRMMKFRTSSTNARYGMERYAAYHTRDEQKLERDTSAVLQDIRTYYDSYIKANINEKKSMRRFVDTKRMIFGQGGKIATLMKDILQCQEEDLKQIVRVDTRKFLEQFFETENDSITEDNVRPEKIGYFIDKAWEEAGKKMPNQRKQKLISSLRGNLMEQVTKVVRLLSKWYDLTGRKTTGEEDTGRSRFRKEEPEIFKEISTSRESIGAKLTDDDPETKSAAHILNNVLCFLQDCISNPEYQPAPRYFYAPFLLTDHVILDSDYIPVFDVLDSRLPELSIPVRVMEHAREMEKKPEMTTSAYKQRLTMTRNSDYYGTSDLILQFLVSIGEISEADAKATRDESEHYRQNAAEKLEFDHNHFIGEIGFAEHFEEILDSQLKEQILEICERWYEWVKKTGNYGFYRIVTQAYMNYINQKADDREKEYRSQLTTYQQHTVSGITKEQKADMVSAIEEAIHSRQYAVAQDLLHKANNGETYNPDELLGNVNVRFLDDFIDHYGDYYQKVSKTGNTFRNQASFARVRNKEMRAANDLADNWFRSGKMGDVELRKFLTLLGFHIDTIEEAKGRTHETYLVHTLREEDGHRVEIAHPIAIFGSGAVKDGFRVICLPGKIDVQGLIDLRNQEGNQGTTLVLTDTALTLSERRRLARKMKENAAGHFFGVLDRVELWYLMKNYKAGSINYMLMELIMPFGYYQPYVWKSATVMPPEIFMGRKKELESIKSRDGANLVYGGRQLGKSALLKKAKDDIDNDENHDRAIYIDIKNCNVEQTASKIGSELQLAGILKKEITIDTFEKLSFAVRQRLHDPEKTHIPFLLLLLDEADRFIDDCAPQYKPLDALKEMQADGQFKFVLAGLHNLVRFNRKAAIDKNNVLPHFSVLNVRPFSTTEASELARDPLRYLGMEFQNPRDVELILAKSNYFPGLIQLYCAKLVEALRNTDYAGYSEAECPIYRITEDHIKYTLADKDFNRDVQDKFEMTLRLGDDNDYYLIALILSYLLNLNGARLGYTPDEVRDTAVELSVSKIRDMDTDTVFALMEEMKELNVLRNTDSTHYTFLHVSFHQMMGSKDEVENKLMEYMGETENE